MTRRALLTRLAMIIIAMVAFVASERATATTLNAPCCNAYTLDIDCSIPSTCFPFKIDTYWLNGMVHTSPAFFGCGLYTVSLVPPLPSCYPNAYNLKYLTISGSSTIVVLNQPVRVVIGGCCYLVSCTADTNGCLYIKITRC